MIRCLPCARAVLRGQSPKTDCAACASVNVCPRTALRERVRAAIIEETAACDAETEREDATRTIVYVHSAANARTRLTPAEVKARGEKYQRYLRRRRAEYQRQKAARLA